MTAAPRNERPAQVAGREIAEGLSMSTPAGVATEIEPRTWAALPAEARAAVARSDLYRALAWAFLYPTPGSLCAALDTLSAAQSRAAEVPTHAHAAAAVDKLRSGLEALRTREVGDAVASLARDQDDVFGHTISAECPPYETQYGAGIIFAQAQRLADIAAFYRAFGVRVSPEARERVDHISAELEFMSTLAFREAVAIVEADGEHLAAVRDAEKKFLVEHLAAWSLSFAERLARKARGAIPPDGGHLAALALCLEHLIRDELRLAGVATDELGRLEPVMSNFEPEGCGFACGLAGEPVLAELPGFRP